MEVSSSILNIKMRIKELEIITAQSNHFKEISTQIRSLGACEASIEESTEKSKLRVTVPKLNERK